MIYLLSFIGSLTLSVFPFIECALPPSEITPYLEQIPDFPQKGIQFQWYAQLLREPKAFTKVVLAFAEQYRQSDVEVIAALDSRGFIFGSALAYELQLPLVLIRKPGKLPGDVEKIDYELEYGHNRFEIEKNSLQLGQKVLIIDDVLATGGTVAAAAKLIERLGAEVVEIACLIELSALQARQKIKYPVFSLVSVE